MTAPVVVFLLGAVSAEDPRLNRLMRIAVDSADDCPSPIFIRASQNVECPSVLGGHRTRSLHEYVPRDHSDRSYASAIDWLRRCADSFASELRAPALDGLSLWWILDITLYQPAWMAIRLIDAARAALRVECPSRVIVWGTDPRLPWKADVLADASRVAGFPAENWPDPVAPVVLPRLPPLVDPTRNRDGARTRIGMWLTEYRLGRVVKYTPAGATGAADLPEVAGFRSSGVAASETATRAGLRVVTLGTTRSYQRPTKRACVSAVVRVRRQSGGADNIGFRLSNGRCAAEVRLGPGRVSLGSEEVSLDTGAMHEYALVLRDGEAHLSVDGERLISAAATPTDAIPTIEWGHLVPASADSESLWESVTAYSRPYTGERPQVVQGTRPAPARGSVVVLYEAAEFRWFERHGRRAAYHQYVEGIFEALESVCGGDGRRVARLVYGDVLLPGDAVLPFTRETPETRIGGLVSAEDRAAAAESRDLVKGVIDGIRQSARHAGASFAPAIESVLAFLPEHGVGRTAEALAVARYLGELRAPVVVSHGFETKYRHLCWAATRAGAATLAISIGHSHQEHCFYGVDRPSDPCPVPTRVALWGERQRETLVRSSPAAAPALSVTGRSRTDSFVATSPRDTGAVLRALGLPPWAVRDRFVVLVDTMRTPSGYAILPTEEYRDLLRALATTARALGRTHLVVRAWSGDDLRTLQELVAEVGAPARYLDPRLPLHNADILALADVVVGQPTSMLAEAAVAGCAVVLLETPSTLYYFGSDSHGAFRESALVADRPRTAAALVHWVLTTPTWRQSAGLSPVRAAEASYGPADGRSSARIAAEALALARGRDQASQPL